MTTVTVQALQLQKLMGMNAWRGKPWGDLGKQTWRVRTWHVGSDCSKYGQQQQGRTDHWRWTAVYDGHSVTVRKLIEGMSMGLEISHVLKLIGDIWRCRPMQTLVNWHDSITNVSAMLILLGASAPVSVYERHPGLVRSEFIWHHPCYQQWFICKDSRHGAQTTIYCAADESLELEPGKYYRLTSGFSFVFSRSYHCTQYAGWPLTTLQTLWQCLALTPMLSGTHSMPVLLVN